MVNSSCNCTTNDRYYPGDNVTRAQLATFLAQALDIEGEPVSADHFTDDGGSVHHNNINLLRDRGIITGCGGTLFCPNSGVKRMDMARWVGRAFDLWQGAP